MNRFAKALARALSFPFQGARSLNQLYDWDWIPGERIRERNYEQLVGDGGMNSIVSACVMWIARTFPEAPPAMWKIDPVTGVRQRIPEHPLVRLLQFPTATPERPGGYYSGVHLWMATLVSWVLDGNAYWLKVRSAIQRPVQLWYVPHWMMEPRWSTNGSDYVSHYDYRVNGETIQIDSADVVHFRYGLDPDNTRKGRAPLNAVLREIFTDDEAARFSASILKNVGVPGVILSPSKAAGPSSRPAQTDLDRIKTKFRETFTGDNRGEAMVLGVPTDVQQFGFSPQQLDLSAIRDVAEERVTAALGIPAAVVGFGAGLQTTKVGATMAEYRDQAWQSNLIPTQRIMGADIQGQLVSEFETNLLLNVFGFDLSHVKILQDYQNKEAERWGILVEKKIAKRSEARAAFDFPIDPEEDDIYIDATASSTSGTPTPQADASAAPPAQAAPDQPQVDGEGKSVVGALAEAVKALIEARPPTTPEQPVQVDVHNNITVPERQVTNNVDARTTNNIPERPVQVDVHNAPKDVKVVRDDQGRVSGARTS